MWLGLGGACCSPGATPGHWYSSRERRRRMELGLLAVDGKALMVATQAAGRKAPRARLEHGRKKSWESGKTPLSCS